MGIQVDNQRVRVFKKLKLLSWNKDIEIKEASRKMRLGKAVETKWYSYLSLEMLGDKRIEWLTNLINNILKLRKCWINGE